MTRSAQRSRALQALLLVVVTACRSPSGSHKPSQTYPDVDRLAAIPTDVVKGTPENDQYPPVLHSSEFEEPVPLPVISTAGAEDSPFIPADGRDLYFVFVADVRQDASVQIRDPVNGIWVSHLQGGAWGEPELVWLQDPGVLALNGCPYVGGGGMLFCSAREGFTGVQWFQARYDGTRWTDWQLVSFPPAYDVGELHISGDELYYGSARPGGAGGQDIWMLTKTAGTDGQWSNPVNVTVVNTPADETRPYVTPDARQLWFTRTYEGSPAVFRSLRVNGEWQSPELIVSRFAGEPTMDGEGNLYFVHHFYRDGVMIEADIYVAKKR